MTPHETPDPFSQLRHQMVETQIRSRGVTSPKVLKALEKIPRHLFMPEGASELAYHDGPIPIGFHQTISQPYIVGLMTDLLDLKVTDHVLEIGTGSGYQTAILAEMADKVYTMEIVPELQTRAKKVLAVLQHGNILFRVGDGTEGWIEHAPYDKIIVTAASRHEGLMRNLQEQLREGGIIVIPIGVDEQELCKFVKEKSRLTRHRVLPVRFVPLIESEPRN